MASAGSREGKAVRGLVAGRTACGAVCRGVRDMATVGPMALAVGGVAEQGLCARERGRVEAREAGGTLERIVRTRGPRTTIRIGCQEGVSACVLLGERGWELGGGCTIAASCDRRRGDTWPVFPKHGRERVGRRRAVTRRTSAGVGHLGSARYG